MALPIILGGSAQEWGGDGDRAKVLLYGADGIPLVANETARVLVPITVRQTAATALGAVVWAIWNSNGSKTVVINQIIVRAFFDGTAAATLMKYSLNKGINCSGMSGGALLVPQLKKTSLGNPVSLVARVLDTGLTMTGISYPGTDIIPWIQGRVTQTTTNYSSLSEEYIDMNRVGFGGIELANQEALVIRNNVVSVVGDNLVGWADVSEK